jgi:hypothetical protein
MILSSLIGGGAKPYLEYAWVTAPNTAGQPITANTITPLTIDTPVSATAIAGTYSSIASNQITLAAGTYYFKGHTTSQYTDAYASPSSGWGLYNITSSSYVTRRGRIYMYGYSGNYDIEGQFTIASSSVFDLRLWTNVSGLVIADGNSNGFSTISTAGADQRTTLKLWKLA